MKHYYNEFDPKAAAWLKQLIVDGLIPKGEVDERSITEVRPADLDGFRQCHFFAGISGWSRALALAGWPEDKPAWTGSCPCPPFSCAGKKKSCPQCSSRSLLPHPFKTGVFACCECGHEWPADHRHLWPEFYRLIKERRPAIVFGEQVAGPDGEIWLAGVRACLEIEGYGVGTSDLCSAGVSAPNIRQRLYWMALAGCEQIDPSTEVGLHTDTRGCSGEESNGPTSETSLPGDSRLEHAHGGRSAPRNCTATSDGYRGSVEPTGRYGFWDDWRIIHFTDGKTRRIKPGIEPLAPRLPGDVDLLRAIGNAINPYVAREFIKAALEVIDETTQKKFAPHSILKR